MLAAHCPQSLTSVDLVIGEHRTARAQLYWGVVGCLEAIFVVVAEQFNPKSVRIQSPHQLAQWSSCEEDENQEARCP